MMTTPNPADKIFPVSNVMLRMGRWLLALCCCVLGLASQAQWDRSWKKIDQLIEQRQVESALLRVDSLLAEVQKDSLFVEAVKAALYKMRLSLEKDPLQASALPRDFEKFSAAYTRPEQQAVLHLMTAWLYGRYYDNQRYAIRQRTAIAGAKPSNVAEWSKNLFFEKIVEEIGLALQAKDLLSQVNPAIFSPLIEKGEGQAPPVSLYDFLATSAIELLGRVETAATLSNPLNDPGYFSPLDSFLSFPPDPEFAASAENHILSLFQSQLLEYKMAGNIPALLRADLARLQYLCDVSEYPLAQEYYVRALENLIRRYPDQAAVIPVVEALSGYYLRNSESASDLRKAYDLAEAAIRRFPKSPLIHGLKNIQRIITRQNVMAEVAAYALPHHHLALHLSSRNVQEIELKIYRVKASAQEYAVWQYGNRQEKRHPKSTKVATHRLKVAMDPDFQSVETSWNIPTPGYGIYEFALSIPGGPRSRKEEVVGHFVVTDWALLQQAEDENRLKFCVVDRRSGEPRQAVRMSRGTLSWIPKEYQLEMREQGETDGEGMLVLPYDDHHTFYFLEQGEDRYFCAGKNVYYYGWSGREEEPRTALFTDRALYRPGQVVHFKGIIYSSQRQTVDTGRSGAIKLLDAQGREIFRQLFTSNGFGSFAGSFTLPSTGLNGAYTLQTDQGSCTVYVEEYKRPTFEVLIPKPEKEVRFGEPVDFEGRVDAYAGCALSGAKVNYRITRHLHAGFRWMTGIPDKVVEAGSVQTDEEGKFAVRFVPERSNPTGGFSRPQFFTYELTVAVTDQRGETRQGKQTFSVGDRSLLIQAEVPEREDRATPLTLPVRVETLNGHSLQVFVDYAIHPVEITSGYWEAGMDSSHWRVHPSVASGRFLSGGDPLTFPLLSYASGYYKLILSTLDDHGEKVETESYCLLYAAEDTLPPVPSPLWVVESQMECAPGEKAVLHVGSSTRSYILYEIVGENRVWESRWIPVDQEIKVLEIPFQARYGDGVEVRFTCVKDEKLFTHSTCVKRKLERKVLTPSWTIFRDKLRPGSHAEWQVTIPESAGGERTAEVMAAMYDASLDALRPHSWSFDPSYKRQIMDPPSWHASGLTNDIYRLYPDVDFSKEEERRGYGWNWFGLPMASYNHIMRVRGGLDRRYKSEYTMLNGKMIMHDAIVEDSGWGFDEEPVAEPAGSWRIHFEETAFFYPQLLTDSAGNARIRFTVPESLTRWNVKLLAHTPLLYFGTAETTVVTQKALMVQLNLPRFARRSDRLAVSGSITNLTDTLQVATARFYLLDPENEQPVLPTDHYVKTVELPAGETRTIDWELAGWDSREGVIARMTATAGNFSDGEQRYLPLLPDQVLLTESLPMTLRANSKRHFSFKSLLEKDTSMRSQSLTVEFSSHPAWYAVQALPSLSTPESDNALAYFSAFYVQGLSSHIARENPEIEKILETWRTAERGRDALLSPLEKNPELKEMLLEETPWLMEARDETEQMRRIALLFDRNRSGHPAGEYLDKMLELQGARGGFCWFEGMKENRYVTQTILLNQARYRQMTDSESDTAEEAWVRKALHYVDGKIAEDYENLKRYSARYKTEQTIGDMQWFYLHTRSAYPHVPVDKSAREAVAYYMEQAEKYWTSATLYGAAATALIAHRNHKEKLAQAILKALKENAQKSDELGMFWNRNRPGYFWNERPVAVQVAIMESFAEITGDTADLDEMKIWLLKQKQTQRWDSPVSTIEAIYALLFQGTDWLSPDGKVSISLGGKSLAPQGGEAGTGYFKETLPGGQILPEMGHVTVERTGAGIGWGALYWQYFQDMDQIRPQEGAFSLSKRLFVEKTENHRVVMVPAEQVSVKRGDKVITRLVVTTDRDLEFVALKDARAACFEPLTACSGFVWREGVGYYETIRDASTLYFFDFLPKGTYVFEYEVWATHAGDFSSGPASIQCQYAPEFVAHSAGGRLTVDP